MTQESHSWAYTQRKPLFERIHAPQLFIAALFPIAKIRMQPKCPPTDEWIKKTW